MSPRGRGVSVQQERDGYVKRNGCKAGQGSLQRVIEGGVDAFGAAMPVLLCQKSVGSHDYPPFQKQKRFGSDLMNVREKDYHHCRFY